MSENLRLLRYNTGNDKKVFIKFKDKISAVIFNATIVAYSSSAIADLVSVYKNQYIIDPQTHIFQQDISAISSDKNGSRKIKKSVDKYFQEMPNELISLYEKKGGNLSVDNISQHIDSLVAHTYSFETEYVNKYISNKDYSKYLNFVNLGPLPKAIIAPYFMLKSTYSNDDIHKWLQLNKISTQKFECINKHKYPLGVQLVLDKSVLENEYFLKEVREAYLDLNIEYAFIWIDDFDLFQAPPIQRKNFKSLLKILTELQIKPIMAYGGYDTILLCNQDLPYRMYGVAHSVGYGEKRAITPVGGGLPVNKYYFPPLHKRLKISVVSSILSDQEFFNIPKDKAAEKFLQEICSCKQCSEIIKNNIDNFNKYNDSVPFTVKNGIKRNRPTTDAALISSIHFMNAKIQEWDQVEQKSFSELTAELVINYEKYDASNLDSILSWCEIYGIK